MKQKLLDFKKWFTSDVLHNSLTIFGIVMCVILVPILIINCTLIVKSFVKKDEVPDFAGVLPLIVLSDSMYPEIKGGDLIICKTIDGEDVEVGNIVSFYDPAGNGVTVVTHEVIERVVEDDGKVFFRTQGKNNNTADQILVPMENVIARYDGFRIGGAGNLAMFMQSSTGLLVCVVLPIVLFVGYDILRRKLYEAKKGDDMAALVAELEALKAANAEKEKAESENTDVPKE